MLLEFILCLLGPTVYLPPGDECLLWDVDSAYTYPCGDEYVDLREFAGVQNRWRA